MEKPDALRNRKAPLEMTPGEFRKVGHQLIERVAEFLYTLPDRPVTPNESPEVISITMSMDRRTHVGSVL
jgi:aromatic-L-amino-acid/L-tryptophan decarboxylase